MALGELPNPVIYENKTEINWDFCIIFNQIFSTFATWALEKILTSSSSYNQIRCTKSTKKNVYL